MRVKSGPTILAICLLAVAAATGAEARSPRPISPGGGDAFVAVAATCPTFSWTRVRGARGYELAVYEAPGGEPSALVTPGAPSPEPVLRTWIRGDGSSWTPPADGCLALAGRYAWSVRALDASGEGEWSEASLFAVEPAVRVGELAAVVERALARYLEERGLAPAGRGELAGRISAELAGGAPPAPPAPAAESTRRRAVRAPEPRGVFTDEVELTLSETGSGPGDKVQLVFTTPEFDGDPSDAWAIIVEAEDSVDPDDGKMFFSTPSFSDALQLFTDGTAIIGDLREFRILPSSSPPIGCTSVLQEGRLYWDSDIGALCACDGSGWAPVDSDETGSCS